MWLIRMPGLVGGNRMFFSRPALRWGCQAIELELVPVGKITNNTNIFLQHATVYMVSSYLLALCERQL